jgi:hypothetical protein
MNSRIVGRLEPFISESELQKILNFTQDDSHYDEFRIGDWKTFVIWNDTGADGDGVVSDRGGLATPTSRGRGLPTLNQWITDTFDTRRLKLVRIHSLGDGVLVPHRDFVEFDPGSHPWTRIHVPIMTNDACLHSEDEQVFRMRAGEIWHLDATRLHSATNFSRARRLNVCLDFALGNDHVNSIFRIPHRLDRSVHPDKIDRPAMSPAFLDGILGLSRILTEHNYRDIVGLLSKVHFYRDVGIGHFFDWLITISQRSGLDALYEKSLAYSRFLQTDRRLSERFVL